MTTLATDVSTSITGVAVDSNANVYFSSGGSGIGEIWEITHHVTVVGVSSAAA